MRSDSVADIPNAERLRSRHSQRVRLRIHLVISIAGAESRAALLTVLEVVDFPAWKRGGCCCRRVTGDRTAVQEKYTRQRRVVETVNAAKRCVYEGDIRVGLVHRHTLGTQSTLGRTAHLVTLEVEGRRRCCEHGHSLLRSAASERK